MTAEGKLFEMFTEDYPPGTRFPMKWEICQNCHGNGTHVNRAIDGNGLDPNDPDLDEDFWDMYRSGGYDVRCDEGCDNGKLKVLDEDLADPEIVKAWHEYQKDEADYRAEVAAERRIGA